MTDDLVLDRAIDDALARAPTVDDPLLGLLLEAHRSQPPPVVAARVGAEVRRGERRRWLPARLAAAALAATFLVEGFGNLFLGHWVSRNLGIRFEEHALFEGGVLFLSLAMVLFAGAVSRRWLDLGLVAGSPVGLALAVHGASELGEFPGGGLLHLSQGVSAVALALLWWRARRYVPLLRPNKGHVD